MNIEWKNVTVEVPNKNKNIKKKYAQILKNANGEAKAGRLLVIMGPSGSGKTTLIKALAGRIPSGSKTRGSVSVNGKDRGHKEWLSRVGFVDQDDDVFEELTVYETIKNAALFRCKDQSNIDEKVTKVLKRLGIEDNSGNKLNSVSGGQRKRVMIGIELVSDPDVVFLDEPTSGLDTFTAFKLITLLKDIAKSTNKTIILTAHQPNAETSEMFDDILLLTRGRTVYIGENSKCEEKFKEFGIVKREKTTFQDFVIEALGYKKGSYYETKSYDREIDQMIKEVDDRYEEDKEVKMKTSNDFYIDFSFSIRHIYLLLKRRFKLYFFTRKILVTLIIQTLMGALILFAAYKINGELKNTADLLMTFQHQFSHLEFYSLFTEQEKYDFIKSFLLILFNLFLMFLFTIILPILCTPSGVVFYPEINLIKREISVKTYSTTSYYLSVFIFENIATCLVPIFFTIILKVMFFENLFLPTLLMFVFTCSYCITFYLFAASIFKGKKSTIALVILAMALSSVPSFFLSFTNYICSLNQLSPPPFSYVFFFVPNTYLNALHFAWIISYIHTELISEIDKLVKEVTGMSFLTSNEDLMKVVGFSFLPNITLNFVSLGVMVFVILAVFMFLTTLLLGRSLKPQLRIKL